MSRISQDFINNVGYLYEEINIQHQDFLSEDSQYYDAEAAELVEEILSTISTLMVCEGHTAEGILGFLADSSEETIIEKYLSFNANTLAESVVSEDYIEEQLSIFDSAINEGLGSLIGKTLAGVGKLVAKRAPALKSAGPLTQKAATRLAMKGNPTLVTKAKVGLERLIGPKGRKAVQAVKDVASKAKTALPKIAKGAGIFGLGAAGGYLGAKMGGAGSSAKPVESPKPALSQKPPAAPKLPAPTGNGGGGASSSAKSKTTTQPKKSDDGPAGETPMQQWARLFPKEASKVKPGEAGYDEITQTRVKPGPYEKKNQTPTTGPEASDALKSQAGADVAAIQAKQKADFEKKQKEGSTQKESYEPYDVILEYLMNGGHADTIEEAHYIMMEMDSDSVRMVVETYEANILAEEVTAWVNELVEEGYDLSEYTWDDMVDYYFTEATKPEKWIQGAIKHPGKLHSDLGVPQDKNIPASKLNAAAKKGGSVGKEARLAKTLKSFN